MRHNKANKWLLEYLDGSLGEKRHQAVKRHIDECDECRAELDRFSAVKKAASVLKKTEAPSHGLDADILNAARMAATRQRGDTRESEEHSRKSRWKIGFRPATISALFIVMVIGIAVFYLPQEEALKEAVSPTSQNEQAADHYMVRGKDEGESEQPKDLDALGYLKEENLEARSPAVADAKKKAVAGKELKKLETPNEEQGRKRDGFMADAAAPQGPVPTKSPDSRVAMQKPAPSPAPTPSTPTVRADDELRAAHPPAQAPAAEPAPAPPTAAVGGAVPKTEEGNIAARREKVKQRASGAPAPSPQAGVAAESDAAGEATAQEIQPTQNIKTVDALALYKDAKAKEAAGNWAGAIKAYQELLKKYPTFHRQEVLYRMGKLYSKAGQYARAQRYYDKLKKEYPSQNLLSNEEYQENQSQTAPKQK